MNITLPKTSVNHMHIVGIDPGFASVGYAVISLDGTYRVTEFGVFRTQKSAKKQNLLATEDNLRRARDLASEIHDLVASRPRILALCCESMSFPRNASSSAKVAMCWGVIASIAEYKSLRILQASPQDVKASVAGSRSASKDDVRRALLRIYKECAMFAETIPGSQLEHPFDALAVAHHMLQSDHVRMCLEAAAQ